MRSILVVDNTPSLYAQYQAMLSALSFRVSVVKNLDEAVEKLSREGYPDMLLVDCSLVTKPNETILSDVRKNATKMKTPTRIVGFSNTALTSQFYDSFEFHIHGFISRPKEMEEFVSKIAHQWTFSPAAQSLRSHQSLPQ